MFINIAECNEHSSAIYTNGIPLSEIKISTEVSLDIICTHMFNFYRPGHVCLTTDTHREDIHRTPVLQVQLMSLATTSSENCDQLRHNYQCWHCLQCDTQHPEELQHRQKYSW